MRLILATSALALVTALAPPALGQDQQALPGGAESVETQAGPVRVEVFADGLENPWAIDFLPDGRALVTEKPGRLRILSGDGSLSEPLQGTPEVFAQGQGGLMDVAVDPQFEQNNRVWLSFAEPGEGGAGTALGHGTLAE
ncbi:MAG TPA: PQQ-dependent sugar dehydrogenase, partial [Kaistia sp.]|nr:PQQ-dependent sugar dehydrogenase [Kaistia sp.]